MASTRDIQRRIKSIKNTRKVTKAMEVVSAAKMKKAVERVLTLRPYAHAMHTLLSTVAPRVETQNPLLAVRETKKVLVLVVGSNRGLCGAFNASISRLVRKVINNPELLAQSRGAHADVPQQADSTDITMDFVTIGRKADTMIKLLRQNIIASFPDVDHAAGSAAVRPITRLVFDLFQDESYDKIAIVFTDYINAMTQEQKIRQLLPVSQDDLEKQLAEMDTIADQYGLEGVPEFTVEPSNEEVLAELIPRVIETQILHALFESYAAEESSRMIAMKNATDAAGDIAKDLTLTFNKLRQAKITQEISEISAGRVALEER